MCSAVADVCYGPIADISQCNCNIRYLFKRLTTATAAITATTTTAHINCCEIVSRAQPIICLCGSSDRPRGKDEYACSNEPSNQIAEPTTTERDAEQAEQPAGDYGPYDAKHDVHHKPHLAFHEAFPSETPKMPGGLQKTGIVLRSRFCAYRGHQAANY